MRAPFSRANAATTSATWPIDMQVGMTRNLPGTQWVALMPRPAAAMGLPDAEGRPVPALYKTTLHGAIARLHVLPEYLGGDLRVAYGHGNAPACNIVDGRDCSLPVFAARRVAGVRTGRGVARAAQ